MLADGLERARKIAPAQVRVPSTPATVWYPNQAPGSIGETIAIYQAFLAGHDEDAAMKRKLYDLAHARAGDKGDTTILSLIAYRPEDFALLRDRVTAGSREAAFRRHHQGRGDAL